MADETKHPEKQKRGSRKGGSIGNGDDAAREPLAANDAPDETRQAEGKKKAGDSASRKQARGKSAPDESASADEKLSSEAANGQETAEQAPAARRVKSKTTRHVPSGIAHINASFNNTMVTITDKKGAVIAWSSAGRLGFAGAKKSSAYAATMVAQDAARQSAACRLQEVEVRVQGPGAGRESAVRALQSAGLAITAIRDVTPIPHNGCRPRKRRRV